MKYLVVVDMQNDFIDGALGTKEAQAIVGRVVQKIDSFDGGVVYTQDTHRENYLETQEGRNLPVEHCIAGTSGWELDAAVSAAIEEKSRDGSGPEGFQKPAFGSVELGEWLAETNDLDPIEEVVIIGLCTDICVISNALLVKAFLPEVKVTVDASCCAGVTPESHKNALSAMHVCQINVEGEDI